MTETKKIGKKDPNQSQELYVTSFEGVTITANSKKELAEKLRDMRENCR